VTTFCDLGRAEEVDGITYRRPRGEDSMWVRELFEFIDDHPDNTCVNEGNGWCGGCDCLIPCCFNGTMRWKPGLPIVRFTSEGLESTVE
jgi:hypothetical protein